MPKYAIEKLKSNRKIEYTHFGVHNNAPVEMDDKEAQIKLNK